MSTILLVQPHRILQQAIALSLFPEHEVRVTASFTQPENVDGVDAIVIDGAWSDEGDGRLEEYARAAAKSNLPVIWIAGVDPSPKPIVDGLLVIRTPIDRNKLRSAVTDALSRKERSEGAVPAAAPSDDAASAEPPAAERKVIDLVDVVEEPPIPFTKSDRTET